MQPRQSLDQVQPVFGQLIREAGWRLVNCNPEGAHADAKIGKDGLLLWYFHSPGGQEFHARPMEPVAGFYPPSSLASALISIRIEAHGDARDFCTAASHLDALKDFLEDECQKSLQS